MIKLLKIIIKNFKLLFRSKTSALIIVLGPLLIMLLVGISFNTFDTFNLNIGVYSPEKSEMVDSFLDKLDSNNYNLINYDSQKGCVKGIEVGVIHTCISFPPDFKIENDKTNEIVFYVDQSKINLVYLIRDILTSSIQNRSEEISQDLTSEIVTKIFETRTGLTESSSDAVSIISKNDEILVESEVAKTNLANIDLNVVENPNVNLVSDAVSILSGLFSEIKSEAKLIAKDAESLIDDLEDYGSLDSNQTKIIDEAKDELNNATSRIDAIYSDSQDETHIILTSVQSIENTITDMTGKLQTASNAINNNIVARVESIQSKSESLKTDVESLNQKINDLIKNIDSVKITNAENIVSPITTRIENVLQSRSQINFLFPSMIVLLVMFIGMLLPSILIVMEKNSRAYFRIFTTPNKDRIFILATFLTSFFILVMQLFFIILLSKYYFNIEDIFNNLAMFSLNLILVMSFFILVGMFIGYLFDTEEIVTMVSFSIGALLLFTSGLIFPVESMPTYLIDKIKFNPAVIGTKMIRETMLFKFDFVSIKPNLFLISAYMAGVLVLIFIFNRINKYKFLHKKSGKTQIKKQFLMEQFIIEKRYAQSLDELIYVLKNLPEDLFKKVVAEKILKDWLKIILKNKYLAFKIFNKSEKTEIIEILEEYSLKKRNVKNKKTN
jgi:ABC-2 type transport system permease protein